MDQSDNLGLDQDTCQESPEIGTQELTAQETAESTASAFKVGASDNSEVSSYTEVDSDIPMPPMKRYAHHGKRRRSYTEELFRCQFTDMISRTPLICNHLLWKYQPLQLREHLATHIEPDQVAQMSDEQISKRYTDAKRIFLEAIPEDMEPDNSDLEELEEDE